MGVYGGNSNLAAKVSKIYAGVEQNLPDGYTAVEYIESGGTQYINADFKANQNTRLVMDFEYNGGHVVLGAYDAGGEAAFVLQNVNGTWYQYYGNSAGYTTVACAEGGRYLVDMDKETISINGVVARTAAANTFQGSYPMILCGMHNAGNGVANLANLKVYSCQIYDNGVMVRDYVPCIDPSGAVGLLDMVSQSFYPNAGSGAFAAGASIEWTVQSVAHKVIKGYVGDANNKAQLIFSAETPLTINYTGTYTDETVQMTDGTYRLLTLTGSGTLTLSAPTECDIWLCGGGASGDNKASGGGGGGYCDTTSGVIQTLTVIIGAGGAAPESYNDDANDGNITSITGDMAFSVNGGFCSSDQLPNGGSGGGAGCNSAANTTRYGIGQGFTTKPFADDTQSAYCAGGGGGGIDDKEDKVRSVGGDGGSNGSNGGAGQRDVDDAVDGTGGSVGGGDGNTYTGYDATAWGGGGGGGGLRYSSSGNSYRYHGGAGYQGCVMVRLPV